MRAHDQLVHRLSNAVSDAGSECDSTPRKANVASPSSDSPIPLSRDTVLFIHGTFAYDERDRVPPGSAGKWWQRGSAFADALAKLLPNCDIAPAGNRVSEACPPWWWYRRRPHLPPSDSVFHWSGANLESARRVAGDRLLSHLRRLIQDSPRGIHIIAHSHGGGVAWEALCLALDRQRDGKDSIDVLEYLKSWTTIGTPFMHFAADWRRLPWLMFCFTSFVGVILYAGPWWRDFWLWTQRAPDLSPSWLGSSYPCYALLHLAVLLLVLFPLHMLWTLFRWHSSGGGHAQERQQTLYDLSSSLTATFASHVTLGAAAVTAWYVDPERLKSLLGSAWSWQVLCASAWTAALVVGLLLSFTQMCSLATRHYEERHRRRRSAAAWRKLQSMHRALPVGYEAFDEALIGLQAIVEVPKDNLLPRLPAPGVDRFTRRGFVRHPEYEHQRARFARWLVDFLVLPYSITRDWVARPFYNDIFAPLVDTFVMRRLWRAAHGSDLRGARILAVTPTPELGVAAIEDHHIARNKCSESLLRTASRVRRAVSRYVDRLRMRVGLNASTAVEILNVLRKAMGGSQAAGEILFHTDYFNLPATPVSLADEVADCISGTNVMPYRRPRCPRAAQRWPRPLCYSVQYEFFATIGRMLTVCVILLMPACMLTISAQALFYPYSRAHLVAWAIDLAPEVLKEIAADTPEGDRSRSGWIRYLASLPVELVERRLSDAAATADPTVVSCWRIEYAVRLIDTHANKAEGVRILTREASLPAGSGPRSVARAHHLLGALRYVGNKVAALTHRECEAISQLESKVKASLAGNYLADNAAAQEQEFSALATLPAQFEPGESALFQESRSAFAEGRYTQCFNVLEQMPRAGNGRVEFAACVLSEGE